MNLRFAAPSDLDRIAAFYHSVWHEALARFMPAEECARRDVAFFAERMRPRLVRTLIAEDDGAVAGFCAWNGDEIGQVYVGPQHRGRGAAEALLAAAEAEMAKAGARAAWLGCLVGNDRARRFYERHGWRFSGEVFSVDFTGGSAPYWRMGKPLSAL